MTPKKTNLILKIILAVLALLVTAALYFANLTMTELAEHTSKLKADIEVTGQQLESYEITKAKVDELSYVKNLAQKILPESENQSAIVAELSEFAKRSNLATNSITFDTAAASTSSASSSDAAKTQKPPSGVEIVPVTFVVENGARYDDLLSFLKYIERNRRKMQVTQISLTPSPTDGDVLDDVTLSINLFVKKASTEKK